MPSLGIPGVMFSNTFYDVKIVYMVYGMCFFYINMVYFISLKYV